MAKNTKTANDTAKAVKIQLAIDNVRLEEENKVLKEELAKVKKVNVELASTIENDLKADLKLHIMAKSDFKDSDLAPMSIEQLQQIEQTLLKTKPVELATYKSIRAGVASTKHSGLLTVGDLRGKKREEILEMAGEF